ncbi:MAG: glycosyltransferase family 39 protein [Nostoc sp. CreGUA01]|nr:glycosyltransferase family 39 protein [Nostoc sp. CreGUA01]
MRHLKFAPSWLRLLIIFLLTMSILFRFSNLDGKVYSHDETSTSLRISGFTVTEVKQQLFNNRVIAKESFAKFQGANSSKSLNDTIMSLAREDSQHPPLYYIIARLWMEIFGNSVTAIRSLSAFISLLVFPCVYRLCRELFDVPLPIPGVAIALMTISPIHLVYAQEAQEYILWLITILLSSASLLRAVQLESPAKDELTKQQQPDLFTAWSVYAITLTISLYTFLWSGFLALAHGIYVIAIARFKFTETVRNYLIASLVSFLAFMPWMTVAIGEFFQFLISGEKATTQSSLISIIPFLLMQNNRIFFDINLMLENPLNYLITPIFLILVGYAIYFLCLNTNYKVWLFIITLIVVPTLPIIIPNIGTGGIQTFTEPYLIPSYLGIQLAVAYLLATQLYNESLSHRTIWHIIMGFLIICGLISSKASSQAEIWWNKSMNYGNPKVAMIINQSTSPLVISNSLDNNYGHVFSLSYLLEPKARFVLVNNQKIPKITNEFSDIFLLNPADNWRKLIEKKYNVKTEIVYGDNYYSVWKLSKPRNLRRRDRLLNNKLSASL